MKIEDSPKTQNTFQTEAKLTQLKAKSLQAVKLIATQCDNGLTKTANQWLEDIDTLDLAETKKQCANIIADSAIAKFLIAGCTAVIAGAPNSGKSTLINALAGKQKAIVSDIAGTTRDWVSINCRIGNVSIEFIDTAGLDEKLTTNDIDKAAQQAAFEMIENADLIIYLNDAQDQPDRSALSWIEGKPVIFVQNKCDLLSDEQKNNLPTSDILISAAAGSAGSGLNDLSDAILTALHVKELPPQTPICFTQRQIDLLTKISAANDISNAKTAITQLLNATVSV